MAPLATDQVLDSAVGTLAGRAKFKDGTGFTEELHPLGKKELSTHGIGLNTPVIESGIFFFFFVSHYSYLY